MDMTLDIIDIKIGVMDMTFVAMDMKFRATHFEKSVMIIADAQKYMYILHLNLSKTVSLSNRGIDQDFRILKSTFTFLI